MLTKHRPVTPTNQPLIYTSYLQNMSHTIARVLTGTQTVTIAGCPLQKGIIVNFDQLGSDNHHH